MLLGPVLALMKTKRLTFDMFSGRDKRNFKKIRSIILTPFSTVLKEVLATKMADVTVSIKDNYNMFNVIKQHLCTCIILLVYFFASTATIRLEISGSNVLWRT